MSHTINKDKREKLKKFAFNSAIITGLALAPNLISATDNKWKFNPATKTIDYVSESSSGGTTSPGGANTNVQYNDGGVFGGDNNFNWDKNNEELEIIGNQIIEGNNDEVQLILQASSSQTENVLEIKNSSGSVKSSFDERGGLTITDGAQGNGARYLRVLDQSINAGSVTSNIEGVGITLDITSVGRKITGIRGIVSSRQSSGTQTNDVIGVDATAQAKQSGGTVRDIIGGIFKSNIDTNQNVTTATSGLFSFGANNGRTASVTDANVFLAEVDVEDITLENLKGINIPAFQIDTGSLTNNWAIFLEEQTIGSTNYQIYSEGGDSILISNGSTQIPLTLRGNSTQDSNIFRVEKDNNDEIFEVNEKTVKITGGNIRSIVSKNSDYTVLEEDYTILLDASSVNVTITLPLTPNTGQIFNIKCIDDTNTATVGRNGKNIDGVASDLTLIKDESVTLQYDGSNWWII